MDQSPDNSWVSCTDNEGRKWISRPINETKAKEFIQKMMPPEYHNLALTFVQRALQIEFSQQLQDLLNYYRSVTGGLAGPTMSDLFRWTISYGYPDIKTCSLVTQAFQTHLLTHPDARLIDLGAGNGIFSWMFRQLLPAELHSLVVPVDLMPDERSHNGRNPALKMYCPVLIEDCLYVKGANVLFISWGWSVVGIVESYTTRFHDPGTCLIVLGEPKDGCTYPATDLLKNNPEWQYEEHPVSSRMGTHMTEYLSIACRKSKN